MHDNIIKQDTIVKANNLLQDRESVLSRTTQVEITDQEKLDKFETIGRISKEQDGKIIKDENEEVVKVTLQSYRKLVAYGGGWVGIVWLNLLSVLEVLLAVYA